MAEQKILELDAFEQITDSISKDIWCDRQQTTVELTQIENGASQIGYDGSAAAALNLVSQFLVSISSQLDIPLGVIVGIVLQNANRFTEELNNKKSKKVADKTLDTLGDAEVFTAELKKVLDSYEAERKAEPKTADTTLPDNVDESLFDD